MKRTIVVTALIACLPIAAVGSSITIDRNQTTIDSNQKDYSAIRSGLDINYSYNNHDDSVGARGTTGSLAGAVVVDGNVDNANTTIDPIDCSHPAYATLCDELMDYADLAMEAMRPEEPVTYVWQPVITEYNDVIAYNIPSNATQIKFVLSNKNEITYDVTKAASWSIIDGDSYLRSGSRNDCYVEIKAYGTANISNGQLVVNGSTKSKSDCGTTVTAKAGLHSMSIYVPEQ